MLYMRISAGRRRHYEAKREQAAICAQAHFRGYRARILKSELFMHKCATIVQATWRGRCARWIAKQHRSAVKIQAAWRGVLGRREVSHMKDAGETMCKFFR